MSPADQKLFYRLLNLARRVAHTCPSKYAPKRQIRKPCLRCLIEQTRDRMFDSGFFDRLDPDHAWNITEEIAARE